MGKITVFRELIVITGITEIAIDGRVDRARENGLKARVSEEQS